MVCLHQNWVISQYLIEILLGNIHGGLVEFCVFIGPWPDQVLHVDVWEVELPIGIPEDLTVVEQLGILDFVGFDLPLSTFIS